MNVGETTRWTMKRMKVLVNRITLLPAALTLSLTTSFTAYAQPAGELVNYTDWQAAAGRLTYERNCASCHGVNLEGAAVVPNLSGDAFAAKWSGAPLEDLATELRQMPPGNTAGLDERTYEALAAYILAFNGIPAAPDAAANILHFQSNAVLPDMTQGQQATTAANIASGAAEVLARLTPVTDEMLNDPSAEDWLLCSTAMTTRAIARWIRSTGRQSLIWR